MTTGELSTVVMNENRRNTVVNLKQVNEIPLRNVLKTFDRNGDGKIDISELQWIVYWYGLWKYASIGLCMVIMLLVWSTFGLTIWAINLTKEYTVTDGVLTGGDEVVKMSVASTYIPLSWATLLDRRHLDALESISIDVTQSSGKFTAGVYHVKVASYLHANSTYLKLFGEDGSRIWVNSGTVVLHHPDADEAIMVCGAAACNTLAVDVKPEYLQQLVQRSAELLTSARDFELPAAVDGVTISKATGEKGTCKALWATMKVLCRKGGMVDFTTIYSKGYTKKAAEACAEVGRVYGKELDTAEEDSKPAWDQGFSMADYSNPFPLGAYVLSTGDIEATGFHLGVTFEATDVDDTGLTQEGPVFIFAGESHFDNFYLMDQTQAVNYQWVGKTTGDLEGTPWNPNGLSSTVTDKDEATWAHGYHSSNVYDDISANQASGFKQR